MPEEIDFHYFYAPGEKFQPEMAAELAKIGLKKIGYFFEEELWRVDFWEDQHYLTLKIEDHFFFTYANSLDQKHEEIFGRVFGILNVLKKYFKIDSLIGETVGGTIVCLIYRDQPPLAEIEKHLQRLNQRVVGFKSIAEAVDSGVKRKFNGYQVILFKESPFKINS